MLTRPPLLCHLGTLPTWIPQPSSVNQATTVFPSEEDLLLHMSTLVSLPSASAIMETQMPEGSCSALTTPSTNREELEIESPDSPDSQTITGSYSLHPRLPITYNEAALSHLQGRQQVIICNNLSLPLPSNSEYSAEDTDDSTSTDDSGSTIGFPAEVEADSSRLQIESRTAETGMDMLTSQDVPQTYPKVNNLPTSMRKMPSHRQSEIPIKIRSLQDHPRKLTRPSVTPHRTIRSTGIPKSTSSRPPGQSTDASTSADNPKSQNTSFMH